MAKIVCMLVLAMLVGCSHNKESFIDLGEHCEIEFFKDVEWPKEF